MMRQLTREDLVEGFRRIGIAAVDAGKIIDLSVYRGSCLMLVSNFRQASQDVDAVASTDQQFIDRVTGRIAEELGWPSDWLNDGVRVFLGPNVEAPDDHALIATFPHEKTPGLRVYVPTAEYMLAMKLMALRIGEIEGDKDKSDIDNLMVVVGVRTKAEIIALASKYYPEARVSSKLRVAADSLIKDAATLERSDETPRYLDRSSKGKPSG